MIPQSAYAARPTTPQPREKGLGMTDDILHCPDVSLALAERVLAGVRDAAGRRGLKVGAAILDRGGQLVSAARMDGAEIWSMPLALDKAYTAVAVGEPTHRWTASTQPRESDWGFNTTLGGRIVVIAGGMPIIHDGAVIGGVGVSGDAATKDRACAEDGLRSAGLQWGFGATT